MLPVIMLSCLVAVLWSTNKHNSCADYFISLAAKSEQAYNVKLFLQQKIKDRVLTFSISLSLHCLFFFNLKQL